MERNVFFICGWKRIGHVRKDDLEQNQLKNLCDFSEILTPQKIKKEKKTFQQPLENL